MNQPDDPDTVNPQATGQMWDATVRFSTAPGDPLTREGLEDLHARISMVVDGWRDEHGVSRAEWLGLSLVPAPLAREDEQVTGHVTLPSVEQAVKCARAGHKHPVKPETLLAAVELLDQALATARYDQFGAGNRGETFPNANPNRGEPAQTGKNRTPQRGETVRHTTTRVTGTLISLGSTRVGGGDRKDHWAILDPDTALVHPIDNLLSIETVDRKMEA